MKLQLALDGMKTEEAVKLVEKVEDYIDIIEIGTPICLDAGNDAVARLKKEFPDKEVLADCRLWMVDILKQKMQLKQELIM